MILFIFLWSLYSAIAQQVPGEEHIDLECLPLPYQYSLDNLDGYPVIVIDPTTQSQWECRYIAPIQAGE